MYEDRHAALVTVSRPDNKINVEVSTKNNYFTIEWNHNISIAL